MALAYGRVVVSVSGDCRFLISFQQFPAYASAISMFQSVALPSMRGRRGQRGKQFKIFELERWHFERQPTQTYSQAHCRFIDFLPDLLPETQWTHRFTTRLANRPTAKERPQ